MISAAFTIAVVIDITLTVVLVYALHSSRTGFKQWVFLAYNTDEYLLILYPALIP